MSAARAELHTRNAWTQSRFLRFSLWHARCLGPPPAANQVLFSDGTEVLLSEDCRLVTVVHKDGKRETQPRRKADRR